jgi:autotransporter adhesin
VANSVAVGQSSTVLAVNGTAIGAGALVQAGATNSVAIGQGSVATAPNTVSFGSPGNERRLTNVAPGVAPTDAINVAQLNSVASGMSSMSSQISGLQSQINRANSGVAMAMAMGGGFLPDNKKFAVAVNYGGFAGESGMAVTALARVTNNIVVSGSLGYGIGPDANQFGGRGGLQYAW